jgi:hypothetical protein
MPAPTDYDMQWFVIRSTARTIENAGSLLSGGVFNIGEISGLHIAAVRLFAACDSIVVSTEDETLGRNVGVLAKLADNLIEDTREGRAISETLHGNIKGFISTLNALFPKVMRGASPAGPAT